MPMLDAPCGPIDIDPGFAVSSKHLGSSERWTDDAKAKSLREHDARVRRLLDIVRADQMGPPPHHQTMRADAPK